MSASIETTPAVESRDARRAETAFVVLVTFASVIALAVFVAQWSSVLPFQDDVTMAGPLDPNTPTTLSSLWMQHNEHRIPLPKLVYLALVGGLHDFRAGTWFTAAGLTVLALALLAALRRRTGGTRLADAVVPLLLLTTGDAENLLNSFQVAFVVPMLLVGGLLVFALRTPSATTWRTMAGLWAVLLLLVACGSAGLVEAIVLTPWPLVLAFRAWRERREGWKACAVASAIGAVLFAATLIAYFTDFQMLAGFHAPDAATSARVAVQVMSMGIGVSAESFWPWPTIVVGATFLAAFGVAVRAWWAGRDARATPSTRAPATSAWTTARVERDAALGVVLVMLAGFALAIAIGWGRGSDAPGAGFANRYVLLAALPTCAAYAGLRVFGRGLASRVIELTLLGAALAGVSANYEYAYHTGHGRAIITKRFEKQARSGAGVAALAHDQVAGFYYDEAGFEEQLVLLRRAGFLDIVWPGEPLEGRADARDVLTARPSAVESAEPARARAVLGAEAFVVPAPARVEFEVPAGARRFQARAALDPCGADPRLRVEVRARTSNGAESVLWTRELAPRARETEDASWAAIDVELPADASRVEVRFERDGPSPSPRWALLSDARFAPPR